MRLKLKIKGLLAVGLLVIHVKSKGQLPEEYITKVSYHEKKEVAYLLPSEADILRFGQNKVFEV